jgi:hypothetical protein
MGRPRASIRILTLGAAAALAFFALSFAARPARAQVPDCFSPATIPTRVVNAVEDEYPLDEFAEPTCENTAKQSAKGCKKGAKIAAGCRDLVNEARYLGQLLACAALPDKAAQKACMEEFKALLKENQGVVKDQATEGSDGCKEDVAPTILDDCGTI